jgi:hypothetical protein
MDDVNRRRWEGKKDFPVNVKQPKPNSIMKTMLVKFAKTWWARQSLKVATAVSTAATVALTKVQVTVDGQVVDPLSASNEAAIAAGVAALVLGAVEIGLSWLAAKDAKADKAELEVIADTKPSNFR